MKKWMFVILLVFLLPARALSHHVVCAPQPGVTGYSWEMDGSGVWTDTPYRLLDKWSAHVCDLSDFSYGEHSIRVKAYLIDNGVRHESEVVLYNFEHLLDKPRRTRIKK